jgi:hypothetical protein
MFSKDKTRAKTTVSTLPTRSCRIEMGAEVGDSAENANVCEIERRFETVDNSEPRPIQWVPVKMSGSARAFAELALRTDLQLRSKGKDAEGRFESFRSIVTFVAAACGR